MKLYFAIIGILFVLATVTNAVTSPITEMALREFQSNGQHQSAKQNIFKSGFYRRPSGIQAGIQAGSAISFADIFKELERAQKTVAQKRKLFNRMVEITNGYIN